MLLVGLWRRVVLDGKEAQAFDVLPVTVREAPGEEHERGAGEQQTDQGKQDHDLQSGLRGESDAMVAKRIDNDEIGITTAQSSGDISPANASDTVPTL